MGIAPAIFDGKRSSAENFLKAFRRYKMMNEHNNVMNVPFLRILTALSYIRGPLVEDWVNAQDEWLEKRVDTTKTGHLARSDEALWEEFVANFKTAWKDTAKTQNTYDQLMKVDYGRLEHRHLQCHLQSARSSRWLGIGCPRNDRSLSIRPTKCRPSKDP